MIEIEKILCQKNIVFAGFTDKFLEEKLKNKGIIISNVTKKDTGCVIVENINTFSFCSPKIKLAIEYKIPIICKNDIIF